VNELNEARKFRFEMHHETVKRMDQTKEEIMQEHNMKINEIMNLIKQIQLRSNEEGKEEFIHRMK
jgi:hypothetical protein